MKYGAERKVGDGGDMGVDRQDEKRIARGNKRRVQTEPRKRTRRRRGVRRGQSEVGVGRQRK